MQKIISAMLIVVGVIHILPLTGVLGAQQLSNLYGLAFTEPNLVILMRHRAVLFGILGVFCCYAAFRPAVQPLAFIAGFVSLVSFLWIAWSVGGYNPLVGRVVLVDLVALVCLVVATGLYWFAPKP
jgi:nicotinamide riboside transporter PnuC